MENKDIIIEELNLKKFGVKGWMSSPDVVCEQCGRSDKAGVMFTEHGGIFSCMRCGVRYSLNTLLKRIGKGYLIKYEESISVENKIKPIFKIEEETIEKEEELPERKLPIGFKRIYQDEYLDSRGFLKQHYELFKPGVTNLDLSRKHTIIYQTFDENNRRVGWLARSKMSKDWHKANLANFKNGIEELKLRYDNSPNTDFSCILGGISDVTSETNILIVVEGLFDKVSVDNKLNLYSDDSIRCIFTFGDTLKDGQVNILKRERYKNIKHIYLLYDNKTILNSKHYGFILQKELPGVFIHVCDIHQKDKDPGELTCEQLFEVLSNSVDPFNFKYRKLSYANFRE